MCIRDRQTGRQACGCQTRGRQTRGGCQTAGGPEASRSGHAQTGDQQASGCTGESLSSTGAARRSSETPRSPSATNGGKTRSTTCRGQAAGCQQAGRRQTGTGEQAQGCCQTHGTHAATHTGSPDAATCRGWKSSTTHPWPGAAQATDHPRRSSISARRANPCRCPHKAWCTLTAHAEA